MATLKYVGKEELNRLVKNIEEEISFLEKVKDSTDPTYERSYAYSIGQIHAYRRIKSTLENFIRKEL